MDVCYYCLWEYSYIHFEEGTTMLILTRRIGETLFIGDDVLVTVLGIKGNQVRIGVHAPKEIPVHREEVYERIKKEKEAGLPPREKTASLPR